MVLSMASLVGFLPYAVFGPAIGVLVDRHDRKKRIQIRDRNPARRIISNTTKPATLVPKLQVLDIFIC